MSIGGMQNDANPTGKSGVLPVSVKDLEYWPRGSLSRRRGFRLYISSTVPEGASSYALFDTFVYDRYVGSTRCLDLMARTSGGRLLHNRLWTGYTESTGNRWAITASSAVRSTEGGQGFLRNNLAYFSDGTYSHGSTVSSATFTLGLDAPTGEPIFNVSTHPSRMEGGWYEYTYTSYNKQRNVEGLPSGFVKPSTLWIFGSSTSMTSYYTLGKLPGPGWSLGVGYGNLTFDTNASTFNLYRRHLFDLYLRPARRADDTRLVASIAASVSITTRSSYIDHFADTELGDLLTYCGSSPRPWRSVAEHNQRWLYVYDEDPWNLWISEVDSPEMVARETTSGSLNVSPILLGAETPPYSGESYVPVRRDAGPIQSVVSVGSITLVLCANQVWRFTGNDPGTYQLHPIEETIGCTSRQGWVKTPFGVLWPCQQGIAWWTGQAVRIVSKGWLDFDDSASDVRWQRDKLRFVVAAYDPVRQQVEFAFPPYGEGGNSRILVLDVGLSTPARPVFAWHAPQLASGETITAMTTINSPTKEPFVAYATSKGRMLHRQDGGDDSGAAGATGKFVPSLAASSWRLDFWVGQDTWRKMHTNSGLRLTQNCAYNATVAASFWSRETARVPPAGTAQTDGDGIVCSSIQYGATELGVGGNYLFMRLRETASSPFEIQDLTPGWYEGEDWRAE